MTEPVETQRKRLHMRSMRRGIKEMDLILSSFAAGHLDAMEREQLSLYDRFLSENDHDLYLWVCGHTDGPREYAGLIAQIAEGAVGLVRPA